MAKGKNKEKTLDKISGNMSKIAGIISALLVIVSATTGAMSWVSEQLSADISSKFASLESEIKTANTKTETQITRLELLNLIHNQPENIAEIEKIAKYYFQDLGGDWYMTGIYSKWCSQYGGDPKIAAGVH